MKTHQTSDPKMEPKSIKNHSKNRCEKRNRKKSAIPEKTLARRDARNPQTQSFQKNPSEENKRRKPTEGWVQGGVQKVECKRHIQKGKCRQGTHYAPKHARWPATTCGFNPSAYGKVPHVVAERGFHRWGFLRLSAGACGKCSNIYFFTKMVSNISKRWNQIEQKKIFEVFRHSKGAKREPKGAKREPKGAKREPKIKKIIKFFSLSVFL